MTISGARREPLRAMRRDAASNRQRLVEAAGEVFSEQGLDGSVEEVARVAGLGMGTLYRHFSTKEALVDELVTQLLDEVVIAIEACQDESPELALEQCIWKVSELQARHRGCQLRLWKVGGHDDEVRRARAAIMVLLENAKQAGTVRCDVTREDISLIFTAIGALVEQSVAVAPNAWKRCLDLMIAGLRPSDQSLTQRPLSARELTRMQDARALRH